MIFSFTRKLHGVVTYFTYFLFVRWKLDLQFSLSRWSCEPSEIKLSGDIPTPNYRPTWHMSTLLLLDLLNLDRDRQIAAWLGAILQSYTSCNNPRVYLYHHPVIRTCKAPSLVQQYRRSAGSCVLGCGHASIVEAKHRSVSASLARCSFFCRSILRFGTWRHRRSTGRNTLTKHIF